MSNFITAHLIKRISKISSEKRELLNTNGFIYFDDYIEEKVTNNYNKKIDRIDKLGLPYLINSTVPNPWYSLKSKTILETYDRLKNNNFFVYKKIDGKDHKVRLKKRND